MGEERTGGGGGREAKIPIGLFSCSLEGSLLSARRGGGGREGGGGEAEG